MWWIRNDPCGMFSALLTVLLILYSQYVVVNVVLYPWYGWHWHLLLYSACSAMALISHTRAQFTDPGAVPRHRRPPSPPPAGVEGHDYMPPRVCKRCRDVKPYRAHHCSVCSRCIIRMDHHCPWVNNCVAIFNQKYFVLFLFYTLLCCLYAGTLLVCRFISCTHNMRQCTITPLQTALCIVNFIEAVVFGLFCLIMMFDQLTAILDNTPGIDALQNRQGAKRGRYDSLQAVFGEGVSVRWLLPLPLPKRVEKEFEWELGEDAGEYGEMRGRREGAGGGGGGGLGDEKAAGDVPQWPTLAAAMGQSGAKEGEDGVGQQRDEEKRRKEDEGEARKDGTRFGDDDKDEEQRRQQRAARHHHHHHHHHHPQPADQHKTD